MKKAYDVVIIGGGSIGASVAYYLTKLGVKDIALVEKEYLAWGSTGRCAGGIRAQWSEPANVKLAMLSIAEFCKFEKEVAPDGEWYQGGYLLVAYTDQQVEAFKKNIAMQQSVGLKVRLVTPQEAKEVVPHYNIEGLKAAAHCPTDGHANPFTITRGYAMKAQSLGADILLHTEVTGFKVKNGKITHVQTNKGEIEAKTVVNAAGGYSNQVGKMAGVEIPVDPVRHQILVTEPIEHIMDPLVVNFQYNIYFRQAMHGAIIAGQSDKGEPVSFNMRSGWSFLHELSKKLTFLMPVLKNVSVVRQWAGLYEMTPDAQPIIGKVSDELDNFFTATGFSGHGFMLAPASGLLLAELIRDGKTTTLPIDNLSIKRFQQGSKISREANVV